MRLSKPTPIRMTSLASPRLSKAEHVNVGQCVPALHKASSPFIP